ncbi:hypothetical protein NQ315_008243 [Exocentrus adspersus]|uniref:CCHC-type domain-containing protein n=1 Tax=Exocentrus adspersus TaxID=1586481 RepID=A0AAV8VNF9_9CUCU|nr:hypothetical protein NQ315_008243 [Exocentrus adspersus]
MEKRVNKCSVPGCPNRTNKRHIFPVRDSSLMKLWLARVANPILNSLSTENIYRNYYVCDKHFSENDKVPDTRRGLKADALPSLYLSEHHDLSLLEKSTSELPAVGDGEVGLTASSLHTTELSESAGESLASIESSMSEPALKRMKYEHHGVLLPETVTSEFPAEGDGEVPCLSASSSLLVTEPGQAAGEGLASVESPVPESSLKRMKNSNSQTRSLGLERKKSTNTSNLPTFSVKAKSKDAVAMIIDGIHDSAIQSGAKVGRYLTPEELYKDYLVTLTVIRNRSRLESPRPYERKSQANNTVDQKRGGKRGKCYNCKQHGHFQSECTKPRVECGTCKKLGHTTENCFKNKPKKTLLCNTQAPTENSGYYVTCIINGQETRGFVDSGCEEVLVRESDALNFGLNWSHIDVYLNGYGGATSRVLGTTNVNMKVDLFQAEVPILVVPDQLQSMPVLIGRSVLNKKDVVTVIRDGNARLFNEELAKLHQLESLPPKKIILRANGDTEILPNHIGVVSCCGVASDNYVGDVFVDLRHSLEPGKESILPRCVISTSDTQIPIFNTSDNSIYLVQNQVFARGMPCAAADSQMGYQMYKSGSEHCLNYRMAELSLEKFLENMIQLGLKSFLISSLSEYLPSEITEKYQLINSESEASEIVDDADDVQDDQED